MKQILIILILLSCTLSAICGVTVKNKKAFKVKVTNAVETQMRTYPRSTLKDIYKNFFQDKYGPGHLISDTTRAGAYIREELASFTHSDGEIAEPTAWQGNFYRVNLSTLKDGKISYPVFFDAFLRSVNGIKPMPVSEWAKEWRKVEKIISGMNLSLPNYEADKKEIESNLSKGNYVGHHSEPFEKAYSPHYRIISKDIYEKELEPLLQ